MYLCIFHDKTIFMFPFLTYSLLKMFTASEFPNYQLPRMNVLHVLKHFHFTAHGSKWVAQKIFIHQLRLHTDCLVSARSTRVKFYAD